MKLLKQSPLFETFNQRELKEVLTIAEEKRYPAGHTVFHEGEKGKSLFFIKSGTISVVKRYNGDNEKTIAFLYEGEPFGEMALTDGGPRSARILTNTPVVLLEIKRSTLFRLFKKKPQLELKFQRAFNMFLVKRLREASENLVIETIYMG